MRTSSLILDGTVIKTRPLDKKATNIPQCCCHAWPRGQKVLLSIHEYGRGSTGRMAPVPRMIWISVGETARVCDRRWCPGPQAALVAPVGDEPADPRCKRFKHIAIAICWPRSKHIAIRTGATIIGHESNATRNWRSRPAAKRFSCAMAAESARRRRLVPGRGRGSTCSNLTRLDPTQWKRRDHQRDRNGLNEGVFPTPDQDPGRAALCRKTVPMLLLGPEAFPARSTMRKIDGWQTLSQPIEP